MDMPGVICLPLAPNGTISVKGANKLSYKEETIVCPFPQTICAWGDTSNKKENEGMWRKMK